MAYYDNYPKDAYTEFLCNMDAIKKMKVSHDEKWELKYTLIVDYINKNKCFPFGYHTYLGCISVDGRIAVKTSSIKEYRLEKLSKLFRCDFIRESGERCKNNIPSKYLVKKDPFKCSHHLRRCPNCVDWIDSHGPSKKYDGYCARCFKHLFPEDPRSKVIYIHTKEIRVRNAINERFEGFVHDKPLYTGECDCTHRRRIDHRKLIDATLLCIETDEFGHRGYDPKDEKIRYDDLYMIHSGKWIFIRFNPDGKGVSMEDKIAALLEEIETQMRRIESGTNTELVEIIKLYYEKDDGTAAGGAGV
jgi:hypothetical protein